MNKHQLPKIHASVGEGLLKVDLILDLVQTLLIEMKLPRHKWH